MDYINRLDNYDGPEIAKIVGIQDPNHGSFLLCSTAVLELCKCYGCWLWRMWRLWVILMDCMRRPESDQFEDRSWNFMLQILGAGAGFIMICLTLALSLTSRGLRSSLRPMLFQQPQAAGIPHLQEVRAECWSHGVNISTMDWREKCRSVQANSETQQYWTWVVCLERDMKIGKMRIIWETWGKYQLMANTRPNDHLGFVPHHLVLSVLLENINSLERGQEFAARINDKTVGSLGAIWPSHRKKKVVEFAIPTEKIKTFPKIVVPPNHPL